MTAEEFQKRHAERYRKIMRREMSLGDAIVENDREWHEMQAVVVRDLARAEVLGEQKVQS